MIKVRNLTKSYHTKGGRHYVFNDVSTDFPGDVSIGIIGPNGSGKSTLLRILGGIDYPDAGSIDSNNIRAVDEISVCSADIRRRGDLSV